jgi:DNA-binding GntR family transcriptional regulator
LKAVLNGTAARQAAGLTLAERTRIADQMQDLNDELAEVLRSPSEELDASYDIDDRLHLSYLEAAGGPRLRAIYDTINTQGERYGRAYASAMGHAAIIRGPASTSPIEHQRIIDAIRAGDPDAADREARDNWLNAAARLKRVITSVGERGSL